jgi:flagellar assembly factor FliW
MITIDTARFGPVELDAEAVLDFPGGLIGVSGTRWALIAREEDDAFRWLQSLDDPAFAVPVTDPWRFFASYEVAISDEDALRTGLTESSEADVYVTVRSAEAIEDFTANLRAPILLCAGRGHQVINVAPHAPLRAPLLGEIATGRMAA